MIPFELSTEESALVRGGFFCRSRENKGKTNMKQLKFMLAAATAISLATAAQADHAWQDTFEDGVLPAAYSYAGETASDNESAIVDGGYGSSSKALQVNTGTDPLRRALKYISSSDAAQAVELVSSGVKSLYIDTMVQFTVTPHGDSVTVGDDDKLMIYLKEDLTKDAESTNLVIRAAGYDVDNGAFVEGGREYIIDDAEVEPNTWYRLVVKVRAVAIGEGENVGYWPVFQVCLNGDTDDHALYTSVASGLDDLNENIDFTSNFVSLQVTNLDGEAADADTMKLTYVGFAGEGKVDDLAFGTVSDVSYIDFTLSIGEGVSAVSWTVNGEEQGEQGDKFTAVSGTTLNVAISSVTYEAGYAGTQDWIGYTYSAAASGSVKITATKFADVSEGGVVTPTSDAVAAVTTGSFTVPEATDDNTEAVAAAKADLAKALTWATSKGGKSYNDAITAINGMNFADTTETDVEQAYLLNCNPNNADELKDAKDNFKFNKFDPLNPPTADDFAEKGYNGTVTVQGAATLGAWGAPDANSKFYRAVLTK